MRVIFFFSYTFDIPHAGAIYINITSGNEIHQRNNRDEGKKMKNFSYR